MSSSVDDGDRKSVGTAATERRSINGDRRCTYIAAAIKAVMSSMSAHSLVAGASSQLQGQLGQHEPAGLAAFLGSSEYRRVASEFCDGPQRVLYACEAAGGGMFATTDGRSLVYAIGAAFKRWSQASGRAGQASASSTGGSAPPARCVYVYKLHPGIITEEDIEVEVVVGSLASSNAIDAAEQGLRGAPRHSARPAASPAEQHPLALALLQSRSSTHTEESPPRESELGSRSHGGRRLAR